MDPHRPLREARIERRPYKTPAKIPHRPLHSFYEEGDLGKDRIYDNWCLEGPSFVWYFRGRPHVHVWVNVADDPAVKLNSFQDSVGV